MTQTLLYKILTSDDYKAAKERGYPETELDLGDGFVHLSDGVQVRETLALHYKGVEGLYLLEFASSDLERAPGALRWELSRGGQLFPHYYDKLMLAWTRRTWVLGLNANGLPMLPAELLV